MKKRTTIVLALLSFLGSCMLMASEDENIRIPLRLVSEEFPIDTLYFMSGGSIQSASIPNLAPSKAIVYVGLPKLVFYEKVVLPDGVTQMNPVASAHIPAGTTQAILLFTSSSEKENESYDVHVLTGDRIEPERHQMLLFNASDEALKIAVDGRSVIAAPHASVTIPHPQEHPGSIPVQMWEESSGKLIFSIRWPIAEGSAHTVVVFSGAASASGYNVKKYSD